MHIAVISQSAPSKGGAYQYSLWLLQGLASLSAKSQDRFSVIVRSEQDSQYCRAEAGLWNLLKLPLFSSDRLMDLLDQSIGDGWLRDIIKWNLHKLSPADPENCNGVWQTSTVGGFLTGHGVDWIFYTTPNVLSFKTGLPYVMPVYDLQHRLQPHFKEVSAHGEWERREYLYRNGTRHATLILADSEAGKEDILECYGPYGVTPDRVKVLPYRPAPYLTNVVSDEERRLVREVYRLPARYLFYPAQFWPHKNHLRVVQAIARLREDLKTEIHLVLCGTHGGTIRTQVFREVKNEARRLRIERQLHYLGYVPNEAMSVLYAEAVGLVMPTFFGPTNIPIVEAWLFGCPVLTSDIRGIREQVGDAGLLVDPSSVEAIAAGMTRLWDEESLRKNLARRGTERLADQSREDVSATLSEIVQETSLRLRVPCPQDNQVMASI